MTLVDATALPDWLDVSRETHQRLVNLLDLVAKWNPAINLVADGTLANGWQRHILDSAQIFACAGQRSGIWADLGSGAGFPGLVLAIIAAEKAPGLEFVLVESDHRKAAFLAQTARNLGLAARIICDRAERMAPLMAEVMTARALAALDQLCRLAARHLTASGMAIFSKGSRHHAEISQAGKTWQFDLGLVASRTDPEGALLVLRNIRHV